MPKDKCQSNYIPEALRTESRPMEAVAARLADPETARLIHAGMGLATEAGEFVDALKKHVFYGQPIDRVNLAEELGDLFWYAAIAADALGLTFEEIQAANVAKLRQRYPEKFTEADAAQRDLAAERTALAGPAAAPAMDPARADEINSATVAYSMFNIGVDETPPPPLPYTLREMLDAADQVQREDAAQKPGPDGTTRHRIYCDPRAIAAAYVLTHYPPQSQKGENIETAARNERAAVVVVRL